MEYSVRYNELLDEKIYEKVHPSGLKIYFIPKEGYSQKLGFFATEYGSIYNQFQNKETGEVTDMPLGIAHFLEHKIFEETEGNIFEKFAKLGANVNAYTNFMSTVYTFSTVDNFYESLKILMEFVQNPHFTDENVEKEKGIIAQEIKMYDDNPDWRVYFNALSGLYNAHPIREDIAGSVESVNSITKEHLEMCYNSFYTPDNMIVFIIGDLEVDKVFSTVEEALTEKFLNRRKLHTIYLPEEKKIVKEKLISEKIELPIPLFYLGFKDMDIPSDWRKRLKKALAIKVSIDMLFGRSTEFFENLYNMGLINNSFFGDNSYGRTFSHTIIGGESKDPEKTSQFIIDEIRKVKSAGLCEKDFTRIKRKLIGRYISSFNSTQYIANSFISHYMRGIDIFEYLDTLRELDVEYVFEVFKDHFDEENYGLSVVE